MELCAQLKGIGLDSEQVGLDKHRPWDQAVKVLVSPLRQSEFWTLLAHLLAMR